LKAAFGKKTRIALCGSLFAFRYSPRPFQFFIGVILSVGGASPPESKDRYALEGSFRR